MLIINNVVFNKSNSQYIMSNLYIFIDESGNFDFSPNGTQYFVLTSMCTLTPHINRDKFLKNEIKHLVKTQFDIFSLSDKIYYN